MSLSRSGLRLLARCTGGPSAQAAQSSLVSGFPATTAFRRTLATGGEEKVVNLERQNAELQKQLAAMQQQLAAMKGTPSGSTVPPPPGSPAGHDPGSSASTSAATAVASEPAAAKSAATSVSSSASDASASASSASQADPAADPDAGYVHGHFSRTEQMQKLQPILEQAERRHAYEGLTAGGTGYGAWSYLYDNPFARMSGVLLHPVRQVLRSVVLPGVLARLQTMAERMVREEVEHNFDAEEFLEGVREAVPTFYEAVAANDVDTLRRMASSKAVEAVERDRKRLLEESGLVVRSVAAHVTHAAIGGVNLWGPASMRAFAPEWLEPSTSGSSGSSSSSGSKRGKKQPEPAKAEAGAGKDAAGEASTSGSAKKDAAAASSKKSSSSSSSDDDVTKSWLVMVVSLDVKLDVVYGLVGVQGSGGDGGSGNSADMEANSVVRRHGTWLLARGPLPKGAVNNLDSRWRVLAWW
ncbi:hypothetical protein HXX76_000573 [Chlamydomonas incerta]|uniref:Tim44-like domain-containing protein n=1 Tax=Chlamydomonas incerta TaxID=51695 RepID=A0A836B2Q0_CHLIN|nr:hypothetical protein HXX76_000573 [Chlamydomonas incerta]|eukprot:KAG2445970.1 hypothetical protein HXX76_000573 [Chlamydomonas incerta]